MSARSTVPPTLLCVSNLPSNAGYAWDFFDGLYARVADGLARRGVGGIPEMIEDGVTGLLVPPADDRALASALTRLLTNPELAAKLGAAARLRVAERFTPEQQTEALIEIVGRCFPIQ